MTFVVRSLLSSLLRPRGCSSRVIHFMKSGCHSGPPSTAMSDEWILVGTSCRQSAENHWAQ